MTNKADLEKRLYDILIAAKALKLAAEVASRLVIAKPLEAEKILVKALKKAEEDGL